jgi:hypothetical protein
VITREITFLPIATVEIDDDGIAKLFIDWSDSNNGEDNNQTPLSEAAGIVLDEYLAKTPALLHCNEDGVVIGRVNPSVIFAPSRTRDTGLQRTSQKDD